MQKHVRFTSEEKEEDIQLILEALMKGESYTQIAEDLGRSVAYISKIKDFLIERGMITQETIDSFSKDRTIVVRLKNDILQKFLDGKSKAEIANELNISYATVIRVKNLLIKEGLITEEKIKKLNKKTLKRESLKHKALQSFRSGKNASEIALELKINISTVMKIRRKLISEGLISEEEILDLKDKSANERNSSATENSSSKNSEKIQIGEQEKQIISLLLKGFPTLFISNQLNMDKYDLSNTIKELKKGNYITSSQINEAREKLEKEDETKILIFLRRGYSQVEMSKEMPHISLGTISKRVNALVASGKITQEQIAKYRYEAVQGEKEIMQFVLSKLQLGFSVDEIIDADENGFLTKSRVNHTTAKLIKSGHITKLSIQEYRAKRVEQKKKNSIEAENEIILARKKEGKTNQEIAEEMGSSYAFVIKRVSQLKKEGKLSLKQIQKSEQQQKEIKYTEVYNTIIHMLQLGCTKKDIAQKLNRSIPFVTERIKELENDGRITNEDIQRWKKVRLKREKQIKNNHKIAKSYLQDEREIDSSTCAQFISSCREMYKNKFLSLEDIPLLRKAIEYSPITEYTMNFMLRVYISFNQNHDAIKFLNSCIGYLIEDPNLAKLAKKTKAAIIHCQKQKEALEMLNSSVPIEEIFKKVGLTESEVIELKNKYKDSDDIPSIAVEDLDIEI